MNPENNVIILQNSSIDRCEEIAKLEKLLDGRISVTFKNGKSYSYNQNNIVWYTKPESIDLSKYYVYHNGKIIDDYIKVFNFSNTYYKFKFADGRYITYEKSSLILKTNCNEVDAVKSLLVYLKKVTKKIGDNDFLLNQLESIDVQKDSIFYKYAVGKQPNKTNDDFGFIFPFGSNKSQRQATYNAFQNDMSLIQGPPGTGKTQTILNIIANAIIRKKTIAVVSNNNQATRNIQEKLEKYRFDFLTAFLGNTDNLDDFFENDHPVPNEIKDWNLTDESISIHMNIIKKCLQDINSLQNYKEKVIILAKTIEELKTEKAINDAEYQMDIKNLSDEIQMQHFTSKQLLSLKAELDLLPADKFNRFFIKVKFLFKYGIFNLPQTFPNKNDVLDYFDHKYYEVRLSELQNELLKTEEYLNNNNMKILEEKLEESSLLLFRHFALNMIENYIGINFSRKDFRRDFDNFSRRFPVMLNTTQALLSSTGTNCQYDYVIIDESSQVSLTTAAVAISIAKNIIIVGDSMQLPHIVSYEHLKDLKEIFAISNLKEAYSYTDYSVLESFKELYKEKIPSVLLREHYRCDPHIINFCNKRFYDNQLLIQTRHEDMSGVEIISTKAHSENNRANERQVCVIEEEVIPNLSFADVGIIAPYNNQVNLLKKRIQNNKIKIETIHSFQGQENDIIILSTVSDRIRNIENEEFNDFLNDPKLLNVAISRARKKLIMVISEVLMKQNGAILSDFSRYIKYFSEAGQIKESKIFSVFDLMYKDYSSVLEPLRAKKINISEFESENIVATLIKECIGQKFKDYDFVHNYPLRKIVNINNLAHEDDRRFVSNELTHCDFVIYNQFDKKPCFVIEVDGKQHNRKEQKDRDMRKDRLLNALGILVYRIQTTSVVTKSTIDEFFKNIKSR